MPRSKGHDKAATHRLNAMETVQFNLRMTPQSLKLINLRITQAIRRDESLKDLLEPALKETDHVLQWTNESIKAMTEISKE